MNWKEYELEVFEACELYFSHAKVKMNATKLGLYSKTNRQIDILIEETIGGNINKIVIDCKLYNKKVDVKSVESFISMVMSMLLFGGATLHYFALALTIGILFGIYSSVFVAAAIAMWLGIRREDLIKHHNKVVGDPNDENSGAVV